MKHNTTIHQSILLLSLILLAATIYADDSDWDYRPGNGGVTESTAGKAGLFRIYNFVTTDPIDEVVLWYAERFGLPDDQSLVVAAKAGFSRLATDLKFSTGYGHDTNERRDHTVIAGSATSDFAHFTILHRPDFSGLSDVTISLSSAPGGTSITVIRPIAKAFRKSEGDANKTAEPTGAGQPATRSESD